MSLIPFSNLLSQLMSLSTQKYLKPAKKLFPVSWPISSPPLDGFRHTIRCIDRSGPQLSTWLVSVRLQPCCHLIYLIATILELFEEWPMNLGQTPQADDFVPVWLESRLLMKKISSRGIRIRLTFSIDSISLAYKSILLRFSKAMSWMWLRNRGYLFMSAYSLQLHPCKISTLHSLIRGHFDPI